MNKKNYSKITEEILAGIKNSGIIPNLMLHSCCAPCSSYVLEYLAAYFNINLLFYNPNIMPESEYNLRLENLHNLVSKIPLANKVSIVEIPYNNEEFLAAVKGHESDKEGKERCRICIGLRLRFAAIAAKKNNADYFASTLTISPNKNSEFINQCGERLSAEFGIAYLFSDFKKKNGFRRSIELSKKFSLYRQNYCGCSFCL